MCIQSEVRAVCNKLSPVSLERTFEEVKELFSRERNGTREILVDTLLSTLAAQSETAQIGISALVTLVHALVDREVSKMFLRRLLQGGVYTATAVKTLCFFYNFSVVDEQVINDAIVKALEGVKAGEEAGADASEAIFTVLSLVQSCGRGIAENSPWIVEGALASVRSISSRDKWPFKLAFLEESLESMQKGRNFLRNPMEEEIAAVCTLLREVIAKHSTASIYTLSLADTLTEEKAEAKPAKHSREDRGKKTEDDIALEFGMNTALRKKLFFAIGKSGDFVEAQRSIYKLALKKDQFREVFSLICKCCIKEKIFNPYYSELCSSLIRTASKNHQRIFRKHTCLTIEEKLPLLCTLSTAEVYNLSRYAAALLSSGVIRISVLRSLKYETKAEHILGRVLLRDLLGRHRNGDLAELQGIRPGEIGAFGLLKAFIFEKLVDGKFVDEALEMHLSSFWAVLTTPSRLQD